MKLIVHKWLCLYCNFSVVQNLWMLRPWLCIQFLILTSYMRKHCIQTAEEWNSDDIIGIHFLIFDILYAKILHSNCGRVEGRWHYRLIVGQFSQSICLLDLPSCLLTRQVPMFFTFLLQLLLLLVLLLFFQIVPITKYYQIFLS